MKSQKANLTQSSLGFLVGKRGMKIIMERLRKDKKAAFAKASFCRNMFTKKNPEYLSQTLRVTLNQHLSIGR